VLGFSFYAAAATQQGQFQLEQALWLLLPPVPLELLLFLSRNTSLSNKTIGQQSFLTTAQFF
jgi:hypothetical protein